MGGSKRQKNMPDIHIDAHTIQQFYNCRQLLNGKIVQEDLWVRDGRILNPEKLFYSEQKPPDIRVDCDNAIIVPGFIDVQINGAFGVDFSLDSEDEVTGIRRVAQGLLAHGVTSFCPTIITNAPHSYKKLLPQYKREVGGKDGAGILGVHLEGPFISLEKCGAHPTQHITTFSNGYQDLEDMYGHLDSVSIVTLAPEQSRSEEVIKELNRKGIKVSLGHSMSDLAQGEKAVKAGACFITHLFNAMLPFHHRDPHLVGLLASDQNTPENTIFYGMISDGIHTHPAALRIAHRTHSKGIVLVTDAIPAMGLGEGVHHIGVQTIEVRDNRAVLLGTDTLCGSIATMNDCIKYFYHATECTIEEALESATLHPAQMLGITDQKGTLNPDSDADFVLLNDELTVRATYIAGEEVWAEEGFTLERHPHKP